MPKKCTVGGKQWAVSRQEEVVSAAACVILGAKLRFNIDHTYMWFAVPMK